MDNIPVYYNGEVYTAWESPIPNMPCTVLYVDEEDRGYVAMPTTSSSYLWQAPYEGIFYREASCLIDPATGKNKTIPLGIFQVYMYPQPVELPEIIPPQEELPEESLPEAPIISELPKTENIEQFKIPSKTYIPLNQTKQNNQDIPKVLGATKKQKCNITLLKKETYEISSWECNIGIEITQIEYTKEGDRYSLKIEGTYPQSIYANIKIYECKPFTLVDSKTWFNCKERLIDWFKADIEVTYTSINAVFLDGNFNIFFFPNKDISETNLAILFKLHFSHKRNQWVDWRYTYTENIHIPRIKEVNTKPFGFPLDKYIGVTQWYGCTVYQCPHGGIDFGARLNKVISIGDGTIVKVGYDKYGGECNQGGNFVIIKHTNGMYSLYFHLKKYLVKVGDNVKRGEQIGISGNSGKANCQPLGYHLHFELRKGLASSTHVNPVEYIDIDWNQISTLGISKYKGRLSGENPHPNF